MSSRRCGRSATSRRRARSPAPVPRRRRPGTCLVARSIRERPRASRREPARSLDREAPGRRCLLEQRLAGSSSPRSWGSSGSPPNGREISYEHPVQAKDPASAVSPVSRTCCPLCPIAAIFGYADPTDAPKWPRRSPEVVCKVRPFRDFARAAPGREAGSVPGADRIAAPMGAMPISLSATVDAPREHVFHFICDLSKRLTWTDHFMSDYRLERTEASGQGAAARFRIKAPKYSATPIRRSPRPSGPTGSPRSGTEGARTRSRCIRSGS